MFTKSNQKKPGTGGTATAAASTTSGGSSSSSASSSKSAGSGVPSIISSDLRIEGNLHSNGDVQVDGQVTGDIISKTLTLGEGSRINGGVEADTVRVCGTVEGEVKASSVILTKTARVIGDVLHDSLAIEAGAYIDGHCRRIEQAEQSAAKPAAKANGAAAASESEAPATTTSDSAVAG